MFVFMNGLFISDHENNSAIIISDPAELGLTAALSSLVSLSVNVTRCVA